MFSDRAPDFRDRIEKLVVEVNDTEPDRDELEAVFDGNRNPDFLTVEYDSLLSHRQTSGVGARTIEQLDQGLTTESACRRRSVSDRHEITHSLSRCEETKS